MIREGRLERFLLLPFSIRCDSESSVALTTNKHCSKTKQKGGQDNLAKLKIEKRQILSKASFSKGLLSFVRRFKSLSQFFVYKEEMGHLEEEVEMEIGLPTDVKHVTHIGLDGSSTVINPDSKLINFKANEVISLPSISLQQFELAMAAQSQGTN